jgi:hypothetical protein
MTRFTPLWQQAGNYPANYDRALLGTLFPNAAGTGAAAAPVANTMNISVPAGSLAVPLQSGQHSVLCRWDAAEVVTSPAAPAAGNKRIDLVVCQVRDPAIDGGVNSDFIFVVVSGVATTGTPAYPATPANSSVVCSYQVNGGVANLNGVVPTDFRRGTGLVVTVGSTTERDAIFGTSPPIGSQYQLIGYPEFTWRWNGTVWKGMGVMLGSGYGNLGGIGHGFVTDICGAPSLGGPQSSYVGPTPMTFPFAVYVTVQAYFHWGFSGGAAINFEGDLYRFVDGGADTTAAQNGGAGTNWVSTPIATGFTVGPAGQAAFKLRQQTSTSAVNHWVDARFTMQIAAV